ncbi:MAG: dihydroorotase, partial [Firmicutes bacterium]|nr:dihydroorotase [Bacillota bacterium]
MMDLLIKGGKVVLPGGQIEANLGIKGGKIAGIFAPGNNPEAKQVKDVTGCFVFPGLIDPHSHYGVYNSLEKDFVDDSQFAALGGFTTVLN